MAKDEFDKKLEEINKAEKEAVIKSRNEQAQEAERLKQKQAEAEKLRQKLAEAEKLRQEQAEAEKLRQEQEERFKKEKIEEYKKILLSEDPELDSTFYKVTGEIVNDDGLYDEYETEWYEDNKNVLGSKYITKRELLLSEMAAIPFDFSRIVGPNRHYETKGIVFTISEVPKEMESKIPEIQIKKDSIASLTELAQNENESLDEIGAFQLFEQEIQISRRDILCKGINPQNLGWNHAIEFGTKDFANLDKENNLTTSEVRGIKNILNILKNRLKELFKGE